MAYAVPIVIGKALPFFLDKKTKEKSQGCQRKTT